MRTTQIQFATPGPVVKRLLIANVAIWLVANVILEGMILSSPLFSVYFGLVPELFIESFFIWQPVTYMFLHAMSPFHVLFNMISLYFFGTELEYRWGGREFLIYYLVTGVGAAVIYLLGMITYGLIKGAPPVGYGVPVVGASGAVFGILLAYGVLFGDREIYFFGVFPIKAKYFVMIIGGYELVTLMTTGTRSPIANLAHLGGLVTGFIYLMGWTKWRQKAWRKASGKRKGRRNLRLVVNKSDNEKPGDGPKYWN